MEWVFKLSFIGNCPNHIHPSKPRGTGMGERERNWEGRLEWERSVCRDGGKGVYKFNGDFTLITFPTYRLSIRSRICGRCSWDGERRLTCSYQRKETNGGLAWVLFHFMVWKTRLLESQLDNIWLGNKKLFVNLPRYLKRDKLVVKVAKDLQTRTCTAYNAQHKPIYFWGETRGRSLWGRRSNSKTRGVIYMHKR